MIQDKRERAITRDLAKKEKILKECFEKKAYTEDYFKDSPITHCKDANDTRRYLKVFDSDMALIICE